MRIMTVKPEQQQQQQLLLSLLLLLFIWEFSILTPSLTEYLLFLKRQFQSGIRIYKFPKISEPDVGEKICRIIVQYFLPCNSMKISLKMCA